MLPFENQTVVITGASSGIGWSAAVEFAKLGANLVLAARSSDKLDQLAGELRDYPGEVIAVPTDVTFPEQVQALVDRAVEKFGRIDVFVNNAGAGFGGAVADVDPQEIEDLLKLNVMGPVYGVHAVVPVMRKQGGGVIANVSSPMARMPFPTAGVYSASKAALDALNWAMEAELARDNIRVMLVYPGLTKTGFFDASRGAREGVTSRMPKAMLDRAQPPEIIARRLVEGVLKRRSWVWFNPWARLGLPLMGSRLVRGMMAGRRGGHGHGGH